ncbi:MAG TPA: hypothetical protein VKD69_01595 [Vicinamibacterales bacterium]|nr:hypothetical protein [Vicinamibacterales bacterium]
MKRDVVERLDDGHRTAVDASGDALVCDEDRRNVARIGGLLQARHQLESVQLRQQGIGDQEIRHVACRERERMKAVERFQHAVAGALDQIEQPRAPFIVIRDGQHERRSEGRFRHANDLKLGSDRLNLVRSNL